MRQMQQTCALVESSFQELMKEAQPKSICRIFELQELGEGAVQIGKLKIESTSLARNLKRLPQGGSFRSYTGNGDGQADYPHRIKGYGQNSRSSGMCGSSA